MGTVPNMLRSLLVIGLLVGGFVALVPRSDRIDRPAIDAAEVAVARGAENGLPFAVARGLGSGWVAENATYTRAADGTLTWQVTYRSPGGDPVAIKQAVAPTTAWLAVATAKGTAQGTQQVGAREWQVFYSDDKRQYALVRAPAGDEKLTTVVLGQSPLADVTTVASALAVPSPAVNPAPSPSPSPTP
jgi:hypothetical protein